MKLVFQQECKHEGNECMVYELCSVVDSGEDFFIATKTIFCRGGWLHDARTESVVFENLDDAIEFAKLNKNN